MRQAHRPARLPSHVAPLLAAMLALVIAAAVVTAAGRGNHPASPGVIHPTRQSPPRPFGDHPIIHPATVPAFHI